MSYCYGRLAPAPQQLPDLTSYLTSPLPVPPSEVLAPDLVYPGAGNDKVGDCTLAAVIHCDQVWSDLEDFAYDYPGDDAVESEYFKLTGGPDTGLVEANVLRTWRTTGLFGNKVEAYVPLAPKHTLTVKQAVELFGLVYTGILVPQVAEQQFANREIWDLTGTPADHDIVGGHAVPIVGYNSRGPVFVTWGRLQVATWAWYLTYTEEVWVVMGAELLRKGELHGIAISRLQQDLTQL